MATARENKPHWLAPAGRSLWVAPVSGVLLFLMLIGGAGTLLPSAYEHLFAPASRESDPQNTDEEETVTPAAPSVGVPRSRKAKGRFSPTLANASTRRLNAGTPPHSRQLISALPVGAFAKRSGAGILLRC
jgi:hypothetical protein